MLVGILVICFTTPKQSAPKCEVNFEPTAENPVEYKCDSRAVAVGDFNNDTWLDIAVTNRAVDSITIFFGHGNDIVTSSITYPTGSNSAPYMLAVGDFNNDHRLDIAVANFDTNSVGIFLGFGNGSFANPITLPTGSSRPLWIKVTDLNNDMAPDIVIVNYGTHSISVLYGYGNATFSLPSTYATGYDSFPFEVAVGDFNNDNQFDLVVANYGTNNIGVLFGSANGTFTDQITFSTGLGSHPYSVTVGHFNDDTLLDIAVANYGTNSVGVFLGYGNGTFTNQTTYSLRAASPFSIDVGDLNHDHRLDLVVTSKGTNNTGVLFGYGNGTFANSVLYVTGSFSSLSFAIDDFNKDNRSDIIVVSNDTSSIDILFGYDEGALAKPPMYLNDSDADYYSLVAVADFNNDTQLDIAVVSNDATRYNESVQYVAIFLGYGNGTFASPETYPTGSDSSTSIAVGDFNNDNHLDIIVANNAVRDISVLLGYGNGSFKSPITFYTGGGCGMVSIAVGDFDSDRRLDIVVNSCYFDQSIRVLLGYGNGSFTGAKLYQTGDGSTPKFVAVGDVNSDNRLDIIVNTFNAKTVGIFLGCGNGTFANQMVVTALLSSCPGPLALGDLNNDSRLDIVVASFDSPYVDVFLGYDNASFAYLRSYWIGVDARPRSTVISDFNNDKRPDIAFVDHGTNNVAILNGYGDGTFANQRTYSTGKDFVPSSLARVISTTMVVGISLLPFITALIV